MPTASKKRSRKSVVSFTGFLLPLIRAIRSLACQLSEHDDVPVDLKLKAFAIADALVRGDFSSAVELSDTLATQVYGDAGQHALGVQIAYLVKKVPLKDPDLDPKGTAIRKFLDAEAQCGETNRRLRPLNSLIRGGVVNDPCALQTLSWNEDEVSTDVLRVLLKARKYVQDVIGAKPVVEDVLRGARFSAGTAIGVTGNCTHIVAKVAAESYTVTRCAEPYGLAFLASLPHVSEYLTGNDESCSTRVEYVPGVGYRRSTEHLLQRLTYVEHDKIFSVLKQATTDRTVGQQPLLNLLIQLGAGDVIERKLSRRANLSLKHGWVNNQQHAFEGSSSLGRDWCTVDLRAASDSIAIEFARLLLPDSWFTFLNCIRTPMYLLPGETLPTRYEKFCAMGNGFCFPLETLLFKALTHGCNTVCHVPDDCRESAVYGDDITVHTSAALMLLEVLELCGFETNSEKTFLFGPFRESCGKDYFDGKLVRPYVQDKIPENWCDLIHVVNSFSRLGRREIADIFLDAIPERHRLYRPEHGPSHTAIEIPFDAFTAQKAAKWNRDLQRWSWIEYRLIPVKDETEYEPPLQMIGALCGSVADWSQLKAGLSLANSWTSLQEVSDAFHQKWKHSEGPPQLPLRREAKIVKVRIYAPDKR